MGRYALGTTLHPFEPDDPQRAAERAKALGFDHVDVMLGIDPASLALPVGIHIAAPVPAAGWTMCPAYFPEESWDACAQAFRDAPGALMEPVGNRVVHSLATMQAMAAEVPGLRFVVDTGHVANWGEDPVELLELAGHVQLRQGGPGQPQLHVDDPAGVVDFAAVLRRLDAIGYQGVLSIEYMDRPQIGYPLADPYGFTMDLFAHVRGLMG